MSRNDHLNHAPGSTELKVIEDIRRKVIELDNFMASNIKPSRELSLAMTKLEECRMWAVKGIILDCPVNELSPE